MQLPCEASSNQVAPVHRIAMRDISRVESAGPGSERSLFALQTLPSLPDCGYRPSVRNVEESPEDRVSTDHKILVSPLNYLFGVPAGSRCRVLRGGFPPGSAGLDFAIPKMSANADCRSQTSRFLPATVEPRRQLSELAPLHGKDISQLVGVIMSHRKDAEVNCCKTTWVSDTDRKEFISCNAPTAWSVTSGHCLNRLEGIAGKT